MNPINARPDDSVLSKRSMKDILPSTFFVMKFCGLWEPWDLNPFFKVVYTAFRIIALLAMLTVGISLVCLIIFTSKNTTEVFLENCFLLFTLFNAWVKALILFLRSNDIKWLLKVLLEDQCQPFDSTEKEIQEKFDKYAWKCTLWYSNCVGICTIITYFAIFSKQGDERIEMLNVWRPYNLKVHLYFWITWIHEFLGHIVTASVHVAADTLIPGLMIQLCCQLKFLRHRLNKFSRRTEDFSKADVGKQNVLERYLISATVRHHNIIYEFANKLNKTFEEVLCIQFLISVIVICFTVFNISKGGSANYSKLLMLYSYTACMLSELFLYCFYGNELMTNSIDLQDGFAQANWLSFEDETKKSLIVSMIRSRNPILISTCSVILVNLDSFMMILKTSYSAYTVLKDTV
ncbi:odorant receptor 46a-like [Belonocnema kinseyi]|uniref:odorant receptor 46a-like n=1 Tax=Belonocnema kinseyi TaxID=2817044 RepID=UPI00143DC064|nr:odorant receptor 46a-like [Belonocnema kinseyi]